ncbi:MAG: methionine ABC transporter permease [Coriobacteriia bacterium]|nr:methionine ABC transporter permease [Coriobacteriia bacterium]
MQSLQEFFNQYGALLFEGTIQTLIMILVPTILAYLVGLPLGVLLSITKKNGLMPAPKLDAIVGWLVNIGRSIPFIILMVALMPLTLKIMGSGIGTRGAIFPLFVGSAPFVARMVEQSIEEVDGGMIEAAQAFGASISQTIMKVIIPESLPSIIRGLSITMITIFGYSAIAGAIGAGGLGDIAIRYGYYRYQGLVMAAAIILSIILIQAIQMFCDFLVVKIDKRNQ